MTFLRAPLLLHCLLSLVAFSCVSTDFTSNGHLPWPPRTPDPKFPKLPYELTQRVDPSCGYILYVGTPTWTALSDQSFIDWMGGCKPVSRNFCFTENPPFGHVTHDDTLAYYQRSYHGVWLALGVPREKRPKCTEPFLTDAAIDQVFVQMQQHLLRVPRHSNWTHAWAQPIDSSKRLPRTFDLPLPAPLPCSFATAFPEECRGFKCGWNVNYGRDPDERFYRGCNMTAESVHYCVEPVDRSQYPQSISQVVKTRSTNGFYEIWGVKSRDSLLPTCMR